MPYGKKDAAKDTEVKGKEVSEAWHTARNDAEKSGDLQRGSPSGSGGQSSGGKK